MTLRIGIDFDNTIVCYDGVFHKAAVEKKLIPETIPITKSAVRDYLRSIKNEDAWTELQGYIYGARMDLAYPYPGIKQFFINCHLRKIPTFIISHKTQYPFLGPKYDLHAAANNWLNIQNFPWTTAPFFELSLQEKLKRIELQQCSIDDLPELLAEKEFPADVRKILFDPNRIYSKEGDYLHAASWDEIFKHLNV